MIKSVNLFKILKKMEQKNKMIQFYTIFSHTDNI